MNRTMIQIFKKLLVKSHFIKSFLSDFYAKDSSCAVAQRSPFTHKSLKKLLTKCQCIFVKCILFHKSLNSISAKGDLCATAQPESFALIEFKDLWNKIYGVTLGVIFFAHLSVNANGKTGPMTNEDVTKLSQKKEPFYGFVPYVPKTVSMDLNWVQCGKNKIYIG